MARSTKDEKTSSEDSFYIGLHEPADLRREILESSKMMIHILQSQRKVDALRSEKEIAINDFRRIVKEINLMVSKIRKRLPRSKLRVLSKDEQLSVYKRANPNLEEEVKSSVKSKSSQKSKSQKVEVSKQSTLEEKSQVPVKEVPKKETEFERLQNQLDEIEAKLKTI